MIHKSHSAAHRAARDAAFRHGLPWRASSTTSGAWISERWRGSVPPTPEEIERATRYGCPFGTLYGPTGILYGA